MFEFIANIFKGGFVKDAGDAIDKIVTSDEERLTLKNELAKITTMHEEKMQEFAGKYETELTERHKSDMQSDNQLAKNIRPASLIFLLVVVCILAVTDGNLGEMAIKESYIDLFASLLMVAFGFYFGGRSLEKISALITGKGKQ